MTMGDWIRTAITISFFVKRRNQKRIHDYHEITEQIDFTATTYDLKKKIIKGSIKQYQKDKLSTETKM